MIISSILAVDKDFNIGYNNNLLYHYKDDMKWFKGITSYKTVIMGRNTYESIPIPLKNRNVIIVSDTMYKNRNEVPSNHYVVNSLEIALTFSESIESKEVIICGGKRLFLDSTEFVDKVYLTEFENNLLYNDEYISIPEYKNFLSDKMERVYLDKINSDFVNVIPENTTREMAISFSIYNRK